MQITARDLELLAFMAEHRLVRADHVQTFLRSSAGTAYARTRALREAGLATGEARFHGQPASVKITRAGLRAIGSKLPVPRRDLGVYEHDMGVAWLWLAARDGAFGDLREVVGERRMRSQDTPMRRSEPGLAVRLGWPGPGDRERLHYPDLLLVTAEGKRVAVELELTSKSRARLDGILAAYGADPSIDSVLYLVKDRKLGEKIAEASRRFGLESLVHVQHLTTRPASSSPAGSPVAQRRPPSRERGAER